MSEETEARGASQEAPRPVRGPTGDAGPTTPVGDASPPVPVGGALLAGFGAFLLYVLTLAPTTAFWDTSEYIATAHILGIPHPPGNPFFVVMAKVWSLLLAPTGLSVAVRINLFAATTSAAAVGFYYLVAHRVLVGVLARPNLARIGAAASALVGATAFTVWHQANVNEKVYTLSVFIIALVSWLAVRWYDRRGEPGSERHLLWAVFLLAIGSTSHLMSVLPAPALAALVLGARPVRLLRPGFLGRAALLAVVGLSFNFVLPVRASLDPVINEGDPTCESVAGAAAAVYTMGRAGCPALASNLTREQYQAPPVTQRKAPFTAQMATYMQYFEWQWARGLDASELPRPERLPFTVLFLVLGFAGLWAAWKSDRVVFTYLAVLAATLTVALVFYLNFRHGYSLHGGLDQAQREVRERDYFFVAGFMFWGCLAGIGLAWVWKTFAEAVDEGMRGFGLTAPVLLVALVPLLLNWGWASRSGDYAPRDWAFDLLMSVEPYGVLFTNGDNDTFPLWYLQEVEGIRRDVTVIVGQYLYTDWYPKQLQSLTAPCPEGVDPSSDWTTIQCQRPYESELFPELHEERATPDRPVTVLSHSVMDGVSAIRLPEDVTISFPKLAVTYPEGMVLDRAQQLALRMISDSVGQRPIFFSSSAGLLTDLGLDRWGVRHGLTTKLELRNLETDEHEGMLQGSPEYGADWYDVDQSLKLYDEVYVFRGLRDREIWADRSTLMIPSQYYIMALQLADVVELSEEIPPPSPACRTMPPLFARWRGADRGGRPSPRVHKGGSEEPAPPAGVQAPMSLPELERDELYRYARHLALPEVGMDGQRRLKAGRVLCVGAGGLGSPLALYLAAAGVGTIGLVDFDTVDESNLQRQLLHGTSDIGRSKLDSARDRLHDVNPHVDVVPHRARLSSENALEILADYDVIVDGTDNFPTRYLVNDACVLLEKPNVYGSVFRWEGQVSVFSVDDGPCYRCLFREPPPPGLVPNCAEGGVLGALPGIIGSAQAMETVKLLLGVGTTLAGRLMIFDALEMTWREVALRRNPDCPVCGDEPTVTELIDYEVFCGVKPDREESAAAGSTNRTRVGAPGPAASDVAEVDPAELAARLEGERVPFLLDVREPWEWAVGSLAHRGARLIPLAELGERLEEVPQDRPVVTYCRTGQRSRTAARRLVEAGWGDVVSLRGGLSAWADELEADLRVV